MGYFEHFLRGLAGFSAVVAGTMMGSIRDPVQIMLLLITVAIALSQARWWMILLASLLGSMFIAMGAYARYVHAGIDPWAVLPLSVSARFVGFSLVALFFRLASRSFDRAKRT